MKLLTSPTGNPKTAKGAAFGYLTWILHLAPGRLSGFNVCPGASKACLFACLNTAGRGGMFKRGENTNAIQKARLARTLFFFNETDKFMTQLVKEIRKAIQYADKHGLKPTFRLNGTSDIRWENEKVTVDGVTYPNIMVVFPSVTFYDYSKLANRRNLPSNYTLTFSLSEDNDAQAEQALENGMNVAVVFRKIPVEYKGRTVVDGDVSDLRFLDPKGVIVGLKAKGKAKKDASGFVRN